MTRVQIIIPVLNRPQLTRQTIESLYDNTPAALYDLYIIDDGSDEETKHLLDSLPFATVLTNKMPVGPGAARNILIEYINRTHQRGEFLYSSDNDVFFKPGWLQELIRIYDKANATLADGKLALIGASCHPYLQNNTRLSFQDEPIAIGIKDAVSGYSQLMLWEVWDKFGPFDEGSRGLEEKTGRSEDWALCRKMVDAGFFVGSVEPELIVPCGKTNTYGKPAVGQETFKNPEGVLVE